MCIYAYDVNEMKHNILDPPLSYIIILIVNGVVFFFFSRLSFCCVLMRAHSLFVYLVSVFLNGCLCDWICLRTLVGYRACLMIIFLLIITQTFNAHIGTAKECACCGIFNLSHSMSKSELEIRHHKISYQQI